MVEYEFYTGIHQHLKGSLRLRRRGSTHHFVYFLQTERFLNAQTINQHVRRLHFSCIKLFQVDVDLYSVQSLEVRVEQKLETRIYKYRQRALKDLDPAETFRLGL